MGNGYQPARRGGLVCADVSGERLEVYRRVFCSASFPTVYVRQISASSAILVFLRRAAADDNSLAAVFSRRDLGFF